MLKYIIHLSVLVIISVLIGCANPVNRVTSDRYSKSCLEAEQSGNLQLAAEACYRAYVNVEWGSLGPKERSEKLYNFGRVLRKSGRHSEAKEALIKSLAEEEALSGKNSKKSGRRMAELSATYFQLNQFENGTPYLDAVLPNIDQYTSSEKQFIAGLLYVYGKNLKETQKLKADSYHSKMVELGYSSADFQ